MSYEFDQNRAVQVNCFVTLPEYMLKMKNPLSDKDCAELFKALADEIRLKILHSLFNCEKCVTDLMEEFDLGQSHVSHHLKTLKVAGLIRSRRDGHKICYSLVPAVRSNLSETKKDSLDLGCCEVKFK